ncbi:MULTISPECIES: flagellar filament capping protein FliD [Vibrio]|jgi:flagellar hook-associated protein 2|uniref:flagellar filament capping protein FliD n=1 Tax=Vibrio TaxID=662 RepID=UPI000C000095|nr:flagellar filament capping protein FliD [Vibrio sp. PID17_43]PHJ41553.1 flagellar capping protein [Vibrio sp. PID17_43]
MSLSPLGMSGGMDINSMVSKIVDAERVPKQQSINNERTSIDASISAYGRLRESLDTMKSLMMNFRQEKAFAARTVETTNDNIVSATATTDAIAGKYAIDVLQLAQSHKVASDVLPEDAKFGPGKLQISLGDDAFDVNVRSSYKLVEVVRGINSAKDNPGVRASLINDVEGPRLILTSNLPGKDNQLKVSVDAEVGNPLKRFEYKTLEDRVNALEEAREAAEAVLGPLKEPEQPTDADGNSIPPEEQKAAENAQDDVTDEPISAAGAAAAKAGQEAIDKANQRASMRSQDSIPGWTETASGTLLDSYRPPELELDEAAIAKAPDVPGWNNTASGTLTDSYVTTKEAQQQLVQEKAEIEQKIAAEKQQLDQKVERGELTEEQAKEIHRSKLKPEERERLEKIDVAEAKIAQAQKSFEAYSGMTQVQAGQDSLVMLDGIAQLSSHNNVIENAIEGVNLTLKGKSEVGKPPSEIGVEYDRQSVRSDIETFVAAYNNFYQTSKALASVDPTTGQRGPLAGDSTVRSADARLKSVFSTAIDKAPENLKSLTEFGITTTRQGTLEINYDMLDRQLNNNFNELEKFFGGNSGFAKQVEEAIHGITGITGSIRTREKSLTELNYRLNDDQAALDRRMEGLEKRTHAKFAAMQDATGKMQGQIGALMNVLG